MTTIIGIQHKNKSEIYVDSRVTDDNGVIYTHPDMMKFAERGAFIIAGSGETLPCDVAQKIWQPPKLTPKDRKDIYSFMIKKAMPSLRECLSANGYNFDEDHDKSKDGLRFQFLMAVGGEIFDIDQDLAVMRSDSGHYAVGSGAPYALGALTVGAKPMKAMEAAAKLTAFTSGPYQEVEQYK